MPVSSDSLLLRRSILKAMIPSNSIILLFSFLLLAMIIGNLATSSYYSPNADGDLPSEVLDDYNGNLAKLLFINNRKRSCLRRGASCDHRPDDCCENSNCRCNVWGTNCRCQRAGLFQRWG